MPCWEENLRRKDLTSKLSVNSRCIPQVKAQVYKQMYTFYNPFDSFNVLSGINSGPNQYERRFSDTLNSKIGELATEQGTPSTFCQITQE